jgi:hypothetical protein
MSSYSYSYQIISSFPSFQKSVIARFLSQADTSGKPLLSHTIAITTATTTTPITAAGRCVAWGAAPVPEYDAMLVGAWGCPSLIWETGTTLLVSGEVELGGVLVDGVVVGVVTTTEVVAGGVVVMLVGGVDGGFVVVVGVGGGFDDVVVVGAFEVVVGGVVFDVVVVGADCTGAGEEACRPLQ